MRLSMAAGRLESWRRRLSGPLTALLLAAVPALGVYALAPSLRSLGQGPGVDTNFAAGLFAAPAISRSKVKPEARTEELVFTDWKFTETGDYSHSSVSADPIQRLTARLDYLSILQANGAINPALGDTYATLLVGDQNVIQAAINSGQLSATDPRLTRVENRAAGIFHDLVASGGSTATFPTVSPPSSPFK